MTQDRRTIAFKVNVGATDDEYNELDDLVDEYNKLVKDTKTPPKAAVALQPRINELMAVVSDGVFEGRFWKDSFMQWEAFKAEFPPRVDPNWKPSEDSPDAPPELVYEDSVWGFNLVALGMAGVRKYMVQPMTDEQWAEFEPRVSGGDWKRLALEILSLNERPVSVPKLPRGFPTTSHSSA